MNVYVACGLTHVPRDDFASYTAFIHSIAAEASQAGYVVRYALKDSDPQLASKPSSDRARLCYAWDRSMVESADVVIAEASYPSIGLGIELQIAENRRTPIVLAFNDGSKYRATAATYLSPDESRHWLQIGEGFVSLMALGLPSIASVVRYSSQAEGRAVIHEALGKASRRFKAPG